jgi:dTDP-4-amino-4,6-dideoxygalactose transaminase
MSRERAGKLIAETRILTFARPQAFDWVARPGPFGTIMAGYTSLHSLGRAAIYWAIRGLQLSPETIVKMPAYHCEVAVQAVLDAGLRVEFYRIRRDLTIDLDDLERRLVARPGPVFVIHYFGFGQPDVVAVDEMCRQFGLPWVEDCAHALFSSHQGRPLGALAPLAIFSLRKTLPLIEGGALQVNRQRLIDLNLPFALPPRGRFSSLPYRFYLREAIRELGGTWAVNLYTHLRRRLREVFEPTEQSGPFQEPNRYADRLAGISRRVATSADPAAVADQRRANWLALDARLAGSPGYCKVFETLPAGTCPLLLVIRASQRNALFEALQEKGIESFHWGNSIHPNLNPSEFSETSRLRDEIICFPVHQQLTAEQIDRMAETARPLLARYGWPGAGQGD